VVTPRERAATERKLLQGCLERLEFLERWLTRSAHSDNRELIRRDAIAIACEHLEQAIDALEIASQE
jgi:hypothetical protein